MLFAYFSSEDKMATASGGPRLEFQEQTDEDSIVFSSVAGEDHWIEHELVNESSPSNKSRSSLTTTAGGGVFYSRQRALSDSNFTFKVVLLGDHAVGKSCIANLYIHRKVYKDPVSTIAFDCSIKEVIIDGVPSKLQLWDTAGMEAFRRGLINQYYRNVQGVIFVYDVTREETFVNIENEWYPEMKQYSRDDENRIQMVLIGNKSDLETERKVTKEEGEAYATRHGMLFLEISSKTEDCLESLDGIFDRLSEQMLAKREENSLTKSMHSVIRLDNCTVDDDWIIINEVPQGPFSSRDNVRRRRALTESVSRIFRKPSASLRNRSWRFFSNNNNKCTLS